MNWTLASRNLLRDRRRSVVTLLAVVIGLSATLFFLSYIRFVDNAIARLVIFQDGNGHVQVYRAGGPENLSAFPSRYALTEDDQRLAVATIKMTSATMNIGVVRHSPQLLGVGMLHNENSATPFLARGVQPGADTALREIGGFADDGDAKLPEDTPDAILLTALIAELVDLEPQGRELQLSAATYSGRFNAIDVEPAGRFTTGIEAIESTGVKLPLRTLQALYDTTDVSRLIVQLQGRKEAPQFAQALQVGLDKAAPGRFTVTRWDGPQVGQLYQSFMGFANTMFLFTGIVLILIAVATVQHTISANVNDRLREIGVLRSMGFSRGVVTGMFVRESLLLGGLGAVVATCFVYGLSLTGLASFQTPLPRLSVRVPVTLDLPFAMALAVSSVVVACIGFAAWRTASRVTRRATARTNIYSLARLAAACMAGCAVCIALRPVDVRAEAPDQKTMAGWLESADAARGGGAGYSWKARVRSVEPAETTETVYSVAVRDGRGLIRVVEPARQAGEKILMDGRAMWYGKRGLRRPVSITPQQRLSGEASNGDIAAVHYVRDYEPKYVGVATIDGRECHELLLTARGRQVTYDRIRYFIDRVTLLGRRAEFMTPTGAVIKTASFDYDNKVITQTGDLPFVSSMKIVNATFPDRYSEITYSDVVPANHSANLFRTDNLLGP